MSCSYNQIFYCILWKNCSVIFSQIMSYWNWSECYHRTGQWGSFKKVWDWTLQSWGYDYETHSKGLKRLRLIQQLLYCQNGGWTMGLIQMTGEVWDWFSNSCIVNMEAEQWGSFKRLEKFKIDSATPVLSTWRLNNGAHSKDWRSMRLIQQLLYCQHGGWTMGLIQKTGEV